jgi:DNA gyrase subunit A
MSNTINVNLSEQLKEDYMAYSMAVLIGRSIPDLYDGLVPSRRRILQTMLEEGLLPGKPYVKCARTTGLTSAYYHPHGSAFGSLVNMATPWNNNVPWVDCHGNIGSTVDNPAAERYLENRLQQAAIDILLQDREVWETRPNYDNSRKESVRLNSGLPTVLLNGDSGIAVGFATKLAPHSLSSVVEAVKFVCETPSSERQGLENLRKARLALVPDFPTGPEIIQDEQLDVYTRTGSGNIRCRAICKEGIQVRDGRAKDRATLTFTNLPPTANPEKLGEQIKTELEKGRIENVAEVNDLSDKDGDCLEVVAKPGVNIENLKQQLFVYTDLELKYSAKTLVIDGVKPTELSPLQIVQRWVEWRVGKLRDKFSHEKGLKESRLHIVDGLLLALDKIDAIIKKIRSSKDKSEAKSGLMGAPFKFSDKQAEAILDMRLRQLSNLDSSDLLEEAEVLKARLEFLTRLTDPGDEGINARKKYLVKEVSVFGKTYGTGRKSPLVSAEGAPTLSAPNRPSARTIGVPKPRFMKVDPKKGTVEQVKGPRGALVLDPKDKVILMTEDGTLKKVSANFKGNISDSYSKIALAKKESEVSVRKYLVVFELGDHVRCFVADGEDLCRATSKGKKWLAEGAKLLHFSEGDMTINWVSNRKKPIKLDLTQKPGKPASKGSKVGNKSEIVFSGVKS